MANNFPELKDDGNYQKENLWSTTEQIKTSPYLGDFKSDISTALHTALRVSCGSSASGNGNGVFCRWNFQLRTARTSGWFVHKICRKASGSSKREWRSTVPRSGQRREAQRSEFFFLYLPVLKNGSCQVEKLSKTLQQLGRLPQVEFGDHMKKRALINTPGFWLSF